MPNNTFKYEIHKEIKDKNRTYIFLDIEITNIERITLGFVYAPNDKIEDFIEECF